MELIPSPSACCRHAAPARPTHPPTRPAGSAVLGAGAASGSEKEVTLKGDLMAFSCAVFLVGYLQVSG